MPGHERVDGEQWIAAENTVLLFHVEFLPPEVIAVMQELFPHYRSGYSAALKAEYWANHCGYCAAMQEDHTLHGEPGGAFLPVTPKDAKKIQIVNIRENFSAHARGFSEELSFFASMRCIG